LCIGALTGACILPQRLADGGFRFRWADLEHALRFELGPYATGWSGPRIWHG
jgi:NAD dependent epimerase/dehydratase family enzyme